MAASTSRTGDYRDQQRLPMVALSLTVAGLYWLVAWFFEYRTTTPVLPGIWQSILQEFPLFDTINPAVVFISELLSLRVLRHFLPVLLGFLLAHLSAVGFVQALYELSDRSVAERLFSHLIQGRGGDQVSIDRRNLLSDRQMHPVLRWGGPGRVELTGGDVAVTELNGRFFRVLGPGTYQLLRFEYVKHVLDLREQERHDRNVELLTQEGIQISTHVTVRFRLNRGGALPAPAKPFPFDVDSVRRAAYAEAVKGDRAVLTWDTRPLAAVIGRLRYLVSRLYLDELIDPVRERSRNLRPSVQRDLETAVAEQLAGIGIELIDIAIGALRLPDDVHQTYLRYWKTFHEKAKSPHQLTAAEKEAEAAAKRAKIRERMIQALATGLADIQQSGGQQINRNEIYLRELLETINRLQTTVNNTIVIPRDALPELQPRVQRLLDMDDSAENE